MTLDTRAYMEQGIAFGGQRRLEEAAGCFREVLRAQPDSWQACFYLGVTLQQQGLLDDAVECYRQTLALQPERIDVLNNWASIGNTWMEKGELRRAVLCFQEVLRYCPDFASVHFNLGLAFDRQGQVEDAVTSYRQAVHCNPNYAEACTTLGIALTRQGLLEDAADCHRQAIGINPCYSEAHNNLGTVLAEQGRFDDAIASYQEALRLQPTNISTSFNLANVQAKQGRLDEALANFAHVLRKRPNYAEAWHDQALAFVSRRDFDDALTSFAKALDIQPDYVEAHFGRAEVLLLRGDFEQGWPEYEWRLRLPSAAAPVSDLPRWDGAWLAGRAILLNAEQGWGDTIQFLRYVRLAKERVGAVLLECPRELVSLAETCAGIDQVIPRGQSLPPHEVQAPLLSLPGILGTTLDTIPTQTPYLQADPSLVEQKYRKLREEPRFKVGLVWQGNPGHPKDRQRSVSLAQLAPLADVPGVALFSLQVGPGSEQLASAGLPVIDVGGQFRSDTLADLAAALLNLDLLVTVDTAAAHLAGALARPVWVALPAVPDWRWLLDRAGSPWYPSMRLFRQDRPGNWQGVFEHMTIQLRKITSRQ